MVWIYALCDPLTFAVRYVGKSINPQKRLESHIKRASRSTRRKDRWILSLLKQKSKPVLSLLEQVDDSKWEECERQWIAHYRMQGADLTNHTDGGDGVHNPDEEARERLSETRKRLYRDEKFREQMLQVLRSPERRRKISLAHSGKSKTPEHVAKLWQN